MKKLVLIGIAVVVKILGTLILGLAFTRDFTSYTSYVSRTNDITIGFLLFILSIDILTILVLTNVTNVFFTISPRIKTYFMFSILSVLIFWLSEVLFIVEIKQAAHWLFTGILLLNKYVVFLLIGIAYTLQIHKIEEEDKVKLFIDYNQFRFKNIIGHKLFLYSKIFYNTKVSLIIYFLLMFYVNFISLFLYSSSIFLLLNVIVCTVILFYLSLIAFHQLDIIFGIYKSYASKKDEVVSP